jgi:hypothetical protein
MTDPENRRYNKTETRQIRARQAARARMTAILLFCLCILFFGITLVKVGYWE